MKTSEELLFSPLLSSNTKDVRYPDIIFIFGDMFYLGSVFFSDVLCGVEEKKATP